MTMSRLDWSFWGAILLVSLFFGVAFVVAGQLGEAEVVGESGPQGALVNAEHAMAPSFTSLAP